MKPQRVYRSYLIDVEGVLVRDKRYEPIAGSVPWFNGLAARGIAACLVSNNTTHRPNDLLADLRRAGFHLTAGQIVGALGLALDHLRRSGQLCIHWLGAPVLRPYLREEGFELVDQGPCDAVVLGANDALEIADLERALPQLHDHGADLVCLHRNLFWLDSTGARRLGPGVWAAALETITTRGRIHVVGKPEKPIYRAALERLGSRADEALFISDDPQADLVTAKRLGMGTAFVMSGKYADHGVLGTLDQEDWPDLICACAADLDNVIAERKERPQP